MEQNIRKREAPKITQEEPLETLNQVLLMLDKADKHETKNISHSRVAVDEMGDSISFQRLRDEIGQLKSITDSEFMLGKILHSVELRKSSSPFIRSIAESVERKIHRRYSENFIKMGKLKAELNNNPAEYCLSILDESYSDFLGFLRLTRSQGNQNISSQLRSELGEISKAKKTDFVQNFQTTDTLVQQQRFNSSSTKQNSGYRKSITTMRAELIKSKVILASIMHAKDEKRKDTPPRTPDSSSSSISELKHMPSISVAGNQSSLFPSLQQRKIDIPSDEVELETPGVIPGAPTYS